MENEKLIRSWIKKHKVALIVTAIVLVAVIAPPAIFLWYANAWNDGMGLPEGFGSRNYPFTETANQASDILRNQFKDENTSENRSEIYFIYNNEKYRLQSAGRLGQNITEHYVCKDASDTKIGSLRSEKDSDDVYEWYIGGFFFFDEHYIYYMFVQTIRRSYYILSVHAPTEQDWLPYNKYTFHRFDLDAGGSEEVSRKLFVENANKYEKDIQTK